MILSEVVGGEVLRLLHAHLLGQPIDIQFSIFANLKESSGHSTEEPWKKRVIGVGGLQSEDVRVLVLGEETEAMIRCKVGSRDVIPSQGEEEELRGHRGSKRRT